MVAKRHSRTQGLSLKSLVGFFRPKFSGPLTPPNLIEALCVRGV
jgi:hypothetical protein